MRFDRAVKNVDNSVLSFSLSIVLLCFFWVMFFACFKLLPDVLFLVFLDIYMFPYVQL